MVHRCIAYFVMTTFINQSIVDSPSYRRLNPSLRSNPKLQSKNIFSGFPSRSHNFFYWTLQKTGYFILDPIPKFLRPKIKLNMGILNKRKKLTIFFGNTYVLV